MIISHKHKYLFVEVPHTASTAISRELREHYDGSRILRKHATYYDFLKIANAEEKRYFVFSGIRNPLDEVVSIYFKYKTDHRQKWIDQVVLKKERKLKKEIGDYLAKRKYLFIKNTNADFPTYFMKFYKVPYNSLGLLAYKNSDFIIRFEHLQADFAKVLELIGIEQKRPLPVVNKTDGKERDYLAYYTPETIARAKRVFGPYMKQWGYEFPPDWGETSVPWWNQAEFQLCNLFRYCRWGYLGGRI